MGSYSDFYDRVKALVKANKLTIEYVVGKAGLALNSYNAYRRRKNLPRADEAVAIAQVLGVSVEYLVTGKKSDATEVVLGEMQAVINKYRKTRQPEKAKKAE